MKFFISILVSLILITVSAEDNKEYAVTGSDTIETNFYKSKCKISEELSKVFEKMALGK